ncbi:MAG: G1 family endopeptidase [Candidatus Babeliales bacterium]|nr:G1 family endopeptidase [Candidatus Babeliales bacterium]
MHKNFIYLLILFTASAHAFAEAKIDISKYKIIEAQLKPGFRKSKKSFLKNTNETELYNWSGYAALTNLTNPAVNSVTHVTGSWIVPKLIPTKNDTHSATWVGIDGFASPTVQQIGTEQDWIKGKQTNFAWFEMYPDNIFHIINFGVNSGDLITASVQYAGHSTFILSITNHTQKLHTVIPPKFTKSSVAKRSSAEWIMEAILGKEVLPLANFNQINFYNCTATINKVSGPINNKTWQNQKVIMITKKFIPKAIPSDLTCGGKNFNVVWKHE